MKGLIITLIIRFLYNQYLDNMEMVPNSEKSFSQFNTEPESLLSSRLNLLWKITIVIALCTIIILLYFLLQSSSSLAQYYPSTLKIPITHIWLGSPLPEKYKNRLEWSTYPYKLLNDSDWDALGKDFSKYKLNTIQRADILRVLYIYEYGGIYADLDMVINYQCLMDNLETKGLWTGGANQFLFCDQPFDPTLKLIINRMKQNFENNIADKYPEAWEKVSRTTGPLMYKSLTDDQLVTFHYGTYFKCLPHDQDANWIQGINTLNKKKP